MIHAIVNHLKHENYRQAWGLAVWEIKGNCHEHMEAQQITNEHNTVRERALKRVSQQRFAQLQRVS